MPSLRTTTGALVDAEFLHQAKRVQKEIGETILKLRPALDSEDIFEAREAADTCNIQLRIAQENEKAMVVLRLRDYASRTKDSADDFLCELGFGGRADED